MPFLDISIPLRDGLVHWPGDPAPHIQRIRDMARSEVCNLTTLSMSAHTGTHMDAPLHFIKDGKSIDQMPLTATVGPARVIEIKDPESIRVPELKPHRLKPGERLLFKTRNSRRSWKSDKFDEDFVYISKEAAQYLVERKIQTVGVDYLSVGGFKRDGVETHQTLLGAGIWVIECLNLAKVKPGRYDLICLPLKVLGAEGAPARAILRPARSTKGASSSP